MKIYIKAKPNAKEKRVEKIDDNHFKVSVKEPPAKGKANLAIIQALARYFNIESHKVKIISGHTSRNKIILVNK